MLKRHNRFLTLNTAVKLVTKTIIFGLLLCLYFYSWNLLYGGDSVTVENSIGSKSIVVDNSIVALNTKATIHIGNANPLSYSANSK
jgi:hypothetical protein